MYGCRLRPWMIQSCCEPERARACALPSSHPHISIMPRRMNGRDCAVFRFALLLLLWLAFYEWIGICSQPCPSSIFCLLVSTKEKSSLAHIILIDEQFSKLLLSSILGIFLSSLMPPDCQSDTETRSQSTTNMLSTTFSYNTWYSLARFKYIRGTTDDAIPLVNQWFARRKRKETSAHLSVAACCHHIGDIVHRTLAIGLGLGRTPEYAIKYEKNKNWCSLASSMFVIPIWSLLYTHTKHATLRQYLIP